MLFRRWKRYVIHNERGAVDIYDCSFCSSHAWLMTVFSHDSWNTKQMRIITCTFSYIFIQPHCLKIDNVQFFSIGHFSGHDITFVRDRNRCAVFAKFWFLYMFLRRCNQTEGWKFAWKGKREGNGRSKSQSELICIFLSHVFILYIQ